MTVSPCQISFIEQTLSVERWKERQKSHLDALTPFTRRFRQWRGDGGKHPVYDFLFTYYNLSTRKLEEWHPGFGVAIEYEARSHADKLLRHPLYHRSGDRVTVSLDKIRRRGLRQLFTVRDLCKAVLTRTERFSCFGMHEWAMLYRTDAVRHDYPLRLTCDAISAALEDVTFCCSHYDAFRFATPLARKLNVLQPEPEARLEDEQGGCIHANMDLYKWAYKLLPITSSDLVRRCFNVALYAREVDMRASPYDLRSLGFEPIAVETLEGRREYQALQRAIADWARSLRRELLDLTERIATVLQLSGDNPLEDTHGDCRMETTG